MNHWETPDLDQDMRWIIRDFIRVTGFDLPAIACAARLNLFGLRIAMHPGNHITETMMVRIAYGLTYLVNHGVMR